MAAKKPRAKSAGSANSRSSAGVLDMHHVPEDEQQTRTLIQEYNASDVTEGQMIIQQEDDESRRLRFKGFLRVHIKLKQAVSVAAKLPRRLSNGKLNPTIPKKLNQFATLTSTNRRESFYLPSVVDKVIMIDSECSTVEVIKQLLAKFKIEDDVCQFTLFLSDGSAQRKITDDERPLLLRLAYPDQNVTFSLKDSQFAKDISDELWSSMSLEDLQIALGRVDEEEARLEAELRDNNKLLKSVVSKELHDRAVSEATI